MSVQTCDEILALVEASLDRNKASDILTINLQGKSSIADYMVIASGTSGRHINALTDYLREDLKKSGMEDIMSAGEEAGDWIVVDAHDVIVHLFRPEVREFYNLEKIWTETPKKDGAEDHPLDLGEDE